MSLCRGVSFRCLLKHVSAPAGLEPVAQGINQVETNSEGCSANDPGLSRSGTIANDESESDCGTGSLEGDFEIGEGENRNDIFTWNAETILCLRTAKNCCY